MLQQENHVNGIPEKALGANKKRKHRHHDDECRVSYMSVHLSKSDSKFSDNGIMQKKKLQSPE